jgi:2-polyprenyl-6-methoxyphenol hydroxylase-like FAD-dependent oxidoreductase
LILTDALRESEWLLGTDFVHPRDENSADGVSKPQNIEALKEHFKDYAPAIQKLLSYVKEAHVWRMMETMPSSWVSRSGKVTLLGDAAHAILPYAGQVIFSSRTNNHTLTDAGRLHGT